MKKIARLHNLNFIMISDVMSLKVNAYRIHKTEHYKCDIEIIYKNSFLTAVQYLVFLHYSNKVHCV
jgi:hypothetical protein